MAYKGKFTTFQHPEKYIGDSNNVIYRSLWERNVMRWLDENPDIVEWGSEEIAIMYDHPIRGGTAKYYPDFILKDKENVVKVVEVKPAIQIQRPKNPGRQTSKYLREVATYAVNRSKWNKAKKFCKRNVMIFEVWTENHLKAMGILNWETDKAVLINESKASNRPKMKNLTFRRPRRPKRRS